MSDEVQTILTALSVVLAIVYLLRLWISEFRGTQAGCAGGCSGCAKSSSPQASDLVQLQLGRAPSPTSDR